MIVAALLVTIGIKAATFQQNWFIAAGVLYLAAFTVDFRAKQADKNRGDLNDAALREARSEATQSIASALAQLPHKSTDLYLELLKPMSAPRPLLDRYFGEVLDVLVSASTAPRVRVCLYLPESAEESDNEFGAVRTSPPTHEVDALVLCGHGHGRPEEPRRGFDRSTPHGLFVISAMNNRTTIKVADTAAPPPNHSLDCANRNYRSFVAVPVAYGKHEYGMLMMDSPDVNGISGDDEMLANHLVSYLGSAFSLVGEMPTGRPIESVVPATVASTGEEV